MREKICVLGLGYIGLPTATMFATNGFKVIAVDVKPNVVKTVNQGKVHIEEPGLKTLVKAAINSGNLQAKLEPEKSDAFIITVSTPLTTDKRADLSCVKRAAESIVKYLERDNLVILESTCPPGTTKEVVVPILEKSKMKAGSDFFVAYSPERVLPGNILQEIIANDRIIGGINAESAQRTRDLYSNFVGGKIYLTNVTTAEMVKVTENAYRDVNIALANELSNICINLGLNVWEVIELANKHPRVNLHRPGPGVGGHCLSIDPWFIVEKTPDLAKLIRLSREINDSQSMMVVNMIESVLKKTFNPKVSILGVTYKGNVDDIRQSPALTVTKYLKGKGYKLGIYDPHVKEFPFKLNTLEESFEDSDCAVILADHKEFNHLSPEKLGNLMRKRQIIDTKKCLDLKEWEKVGFKVSLLGQGKSQHDWF